MKTSIFKKCALVGALALPVGGVAFGGIQALEATSAGASGSTVCMSGNMTISIGSSLSVTVNMAKGSDGTDPTGCVAVSSDVSTLGYTIPSSGISNSDVQSLTLPAASIISDDSTTFTVSDSAASPAVPTSAVLNQTAFPGCELTNLASQNDVALSGSGGSVSGGPYQEKSNINIANYSGTCSTASRTFLSSQIANGVTISGSLTLS